MKTLPMTGDSPATRIGLTTKTSSPVWPAMVRSPLLASAVMTSLPPPA
jgi:hypothetical protein